jgi:hypothetical protein
MFFLRKEWQDPENGIETVILHWIATPLEHEPCWTKANRMVMTARSNVSPVRRRCSLWVAPPFSRRSLFAMNPVEQPTGFLLHSFFEVVQRGRVWKTETESQEMRSVIITHSDPSAECTEAFLHYSLDELEHVQSVAMVLEGVPPSYQLLPSFPAGVLCPKSQKKRAKKYKHMARLPLPHTFRGRIWGPPETRVLYAVYFNRQGTYNPFNEGGFWLLKDGGFWEVTL